MVSARVAAVVVGRNEGQLLLECLRSVTACFDRVVYVDSGSWDSSPDRAESLGVVVIRLTAGPHTAARGRQIGLEEALRRWPQTQYVQFVDGDCVLDPTWPATAEAYLDSTPQAACVCGRRRETRSVQSLYSRMVDLEWDEPPGDSSYAGGDALYRAEAILQAGGWPVDMIAGEDPELWLRLRKRGWRVFRLDHMQTWHDIRIARFSEYLKRAVRSGHAFAEIAWRHNRGYARVLNRRVVGSFLFGALFPLAMVAAVFWHLWAIVAVLLLAYLKNVISFMAWTRGRGASFRLASAYTLMSILSRPAEAIGVVKYLLGHASGKKSALIEYKSDRTSAHEASQRHKTAR